MTSRGPAASSQAAFLGASICLISLKEPTRIRIWTDDIPFKPGAIWETPMCPEGGSDKPAGGRVLAWVPLPSPGPRSASGPSLFRWFVAHLY